MSERKNSVLNVLDVLRKYSDEKHPPNLFANH